MKFRSHYLKLPIVLILFFCFGIESFGLQERPIRISPIQIKWNAEAQLFQAYFDVTNDTPRNVDLTSIIIFKIGRYKRWRGTKLPGLKAHKTDSFKISFSPGIMLKNEYFSITVNIYGKDYVGLIDYSSRYLNISSRRVIDQEGTKIELTEAPPLSLTELERKKAELVRRFEEDSEPEEQELVTGVAEPEQEEQKTVAGAAEPEPEKEAQAAEKRELVPVVAKKTLIVMGPAKRRIQLLATEKFQNASLEKVSPEEKQQLKAAKKIEPPPPEPPSAPEVLTVTPGKNQNRLNWKPVTDATAYNLYWGRSAGVTRESGNKIENVNSGYRHTGLLEDAPLYYILIAEKDGLEGEPSAEVSAKPLIPPRESPVLSATPERYQNRLLWAPLESVKSYNLYWSAAPGVTPDNGTKIENVSSGYIHTGLEEPGPYYYIVTAKKDGFESKPSNEVSAKPVLPPKNIPQLTVLAGDGNLQLNWKPIAGVTAYHLYWGTEKEFEPSRERKMVLQGTGFQHTGLENEQTYYYVMAAVNEDGEGEASPVASGTPVRLEATVSELLEGAQLDDFTAIKTDPGLLMSISDVALERQASLKRAEELTELDISSRDKLISLYIAEGKSESVAKVLSGQLSKEPENLNLTLSLSKVYHEQGDIKAALKVLNSSLNRISLSARIALNQELKTSVRKGESTLTTKSEEAYLADEFSRLGISLLERKKYVEALSAFQSLYSLSQDYPMVKYYLGLSRQGMKQYNQAKQLFVEQATVDIQKKQLMDDLAALTLVLAVTLDIPTIKDTRGRYVTMQRGENTPQESETIVTQIATLDALLAEAEKRRLAGLPDLAIAMADDFNRAEIQPGQKIRFAFTTTNLGKKQSEPYRVYYQLKHAQGMTFDIPGFDRFKLLPAQNATYNWQKEIQVPDGVVPGKYQLIANVEQTGGKGEVTFDNNRVQSAPGISVIQPVPDLEIRFADKLPDMPIETGLTVTVKPIVTNIGFKDSPSFEVDYFLESEDGDSYDLNIKDKQPSLKKGNKSVTLEKELPISIELEEGRYQVVARIRLAKKAVEQNPKNNTAGSGFNLIYAPPFTDLSLSFKQQPPDETLIAGHSFSSALQIENSGNRISSGGIIVYQLEDEDGDEITLKEESRFPAVKQKQAPIIISRELTLPEKLPQGSYRLIAELELDDDDLEQNSKNNRIISENQLKIEPSFSDFSLALDIDDQETPIKPGETIPIEALLKNTGNRDIAELTIHFTLKSRSGEELKIQPAERITNLAAGAEKVLEKNILIPEDLPEGLYQAVARAEIEDEDFEKNSSNNLDHSPYLFSYIKPKPVVVAEEPAATAEQLVEETEEQRVTNWVRHASAISLAVGGTWMALEEDKKYKSAQDKEDELEGQYSSSQSSSQVSSIESDLDNTRSEMKLYAQNTNLWATLALVGVGWEVYNIFFYEPGQTASQTIGGFTLNNKWAHASAVGLAAIAFWQSQNEVKKHDELSDENDSLKAQYQTASTAEEVASIKSRIASNETKMSNHISNANIFDGVTLAAIGFESYLLWKAFSDPDAGIVKLRYQNSDGFQLKPVMAYERVGLNLKYTW